MSITVMEVFKHLGVQPTSVLSWSVGGQVAAMYRLTYGRQPPKDNRPKTTGAGTHCFAIYPDNWYDKIAAIIEKAQVQHDSQGGLF